MADWLGVDVQESTHLLRCRVCGERKPREEFYYSKGWQSRPCRPCNRAYTRQRGMERAEYLRKYRLDRGCMDCGYREHWIALEFDHRPGEVKLFEVSQFRFIGSWQQMLDEIAKCDVVCSNCHRIRTHERGDSGNNANHDRRTRRVVAGIFAEDRDQLALFDETA